MMVIPAARAFDFETDIFDYVNELVWEYHLDAQTGKARTEKRVPPPTYAHHCFVVARSARQFFRAAEFDPHSAAPDDAEQARRIQTVIRTDPRADAPVASKIKFPGYANLREFSRARPELLKAHCGGSWQSYLQRGNWRMVLPFTRAGQQRTAEKLQERVAAGLLPIIHVATFPALSINHALMLFGCSSSASAIEFIAYDPNLSDRPLTLVFDYPSRSFQFPLTHYFGGGPVNNAYEIYSSRVF